MKKNTIISLLLCALFILSAIPVIGQSRNDASGPYRLTTTLEETMAVSRMRDGSIPVTNVMVPEIMSGEINGIIITEQDVHEALNVLHDAYARYNYIIPNLVTSSISISAWVPSSEYLEREREFLQTFVVVENYAAEQRSTSPPTQYSPLRWYSHEWSGTINFTFTRFLIPGTPPGMGNSGNFLTTTAETNHHVTYRSRNGGDLGTQIATLHSGRFRTGIAHPVTFYGEIHNRPWGERSRNAFWTIDHN